MATSLASAAHAQRLAPVTPGSPQAEADRPGGRYALLRQDEDWSHIPADGRDAPFDRLKHFAIDRHGDISASVAVDGYVSFRQYTDQLLGRVPGPNPALNTRLNVHVGVDLDDRVRLYAALKHGDNEFGAEPVAPVDRNRLDLHQAFVQFNFGDAFGGERKDVLVRVGRQEISYGAGRLISARLGPNVRSNFDGVTLRARAGPVVADAFVMRGVQDRTGVFDDAPDRGTALWGGYATRYGRRANVDVFYMGQHAKRAGYWVDPQPLDEMRHTVGARFWAPPGPGWTFDLEGEYQFGTARRAAASAIPTGLTISAWSISGTVGYVFPNDVALQPVAALEFGATSGDSDPGNAALGTFRAPAPPGRYFGEANPFGPGNLIGFRPYFELHPAKPLTLRAKSTFLWRLTTRDGTYSTVPDRLSGPTGTQQFVGVEPGVQVNYDLSPKWSVISYLAHYFAGPYARDNQPGRDVNYLELTLALRI